MIGIYMYENKVNHKKYIGQSVNIEKRRKEHLKRPSPYSYFDNTLHAIGEEAFTFSILEECSAEQLDEREKYWITYYNSILDGYNLTSGGQTYKGEDNPWAKLKETQVKQIIVLLEEGKLTNKQIAEQFQVHYNTVDYINRCQIWTHLHNYKQNIRNENMKDGKRFGMGETNVTAKITEEQALYIIHLLESDKRSQAQISRDENISIHILQDINRCRTWKHLHNYKKNIRKEYALRQEVM